jgi:hypothetical protein
VRPDVSTPLQSFRNKTSSSCDAYELVGVVVAHPLLDDDERRRDPGVSPRQSLPPKTAATAGRHAAAAAAAAASAIRQRARAGADLFGPCVEELAVRCARCGSLA